ncbi:hypothetical protein HDU98_003246 [Podochytrium sp. JEL0797]|nr:hypothetical protein HDU98_003246 [Podochytrium sp. JEL0797]
MDENAAITIQRIYRGHRVRQTIRHLHIHARTIQSLFRGFLARQKYQHLVSTTRTLSRHEHRLQSIQSRLATREKDLRVLKATHHDRVDQVSREWRSNAALVIQKTYRGYLVRRRMKRVVGEFGAAGKRRKGALSRASANREVEEVDGKRKRNVKFESDTDESEIETLEPFNGDEPGLIATLEESDIVAAREKVIEKLCKTRHPVGVAKERETAANLLENLGTAQKLLDQYYDSVEALDFTERNTLKFLPQDVSLGCRMLRVRTENYLDALLDCKELDDPSELLFKKSLMASCDRARIREEHLRSLKDGKMRWWEFDLERYSAFNELMDLDLEDVEKSVREY